MRKMFSTVLVAGLSIALLGCPGGGGDTTDKPDTDKPDTDKTDTDTPDTKPAAADKPAEKKSVDLSHVKVGQKYHYHMSSPAEMDMIYEVKEIGDSELKYEITSLMNGKAVGPATPLTWSIPVPVASVKPDPNAKPLKMTKETITVAGTEWDCMVSEAAGSKTWVPMKNGMSTWPMFIKTEKDGKVTNTLTKIE